MTLENYQLLIAFQRVTFLDVISPQIITRSTLFMLEDVYYLPVGIRTVKVEGTNFLINNKPFYFKGFGKHEDADVRVYNVLCCFV